MTDYKDLAQIYQQRALEAAGTPEANEHLAHAKRYREAAERIAQLEAELAECKVEATKANAACLDWTERAFNERNRCKALAAIVKQQRIALDGAWQDGYCFCGPEGFTSEQKAVEQALALDTTQAEQILAKLDAEVLRSVLTLGGFTQELEDSVRRMAGEIENQINLPL